MEEKPPQNYDLNYHFYSYLKMISFCQFTVKALLGHGMCKRDLTKSNIIIFGWDYGLSCSSIFFSIWLSCSLSQMTYYNLFLLRPKQRWHHWRGHHPGISNFCSEWQASLENEGGDGQSSGRVGCPEANRRGPEERTSETGRDDLKTGPGSGERWSYFQC